MTKRFTPASVINLVRNIPTGQAIWVAWIFLLPCNPANAIEPNVFTWGNIDLAPTLRSEITFDDNIYRQGSNEVDSVVGTITPSVVAGYTDEVNSYQLELEGTRGLYSATSEDDYTAWSLAADAHVEVTQRHLLDFNFAYEDAIQPRGSGFSQFGFLPDEPDEFTAQDTGVTYQFGANDSLARLVLEVNHRDREFTNNSRFIVGRDYQRTGWRGSFLYNVLPRTDILFEVRGADFDYDDNFQSGAQQFAQLDSEEVYVFIGATWEATARTTGSVRIGRADKDFKSPQRRDIDEPSYEIGLQYAPLTYSIFGFSANQNFEEGIGIGSALKRRSVQLDWRHEWSERLFSEVTVSVQDDDYVGSTLTDSFDRYSASINYAFQRWLDIRVGFQVENRDSNAAQFNADRTGLIVGFEASF